MRMRQAIFMSKVRNNSIPKTILGLCWGAHAIARHSLPSLNLSCGGILLYVREDIPWNLITVDINPIESFYAELNLRNNKW